MESNSSSSGNGIREAYKRILDAILALLDKGTIPWRKTWNASAEAPANATTGKDYRGINVFILLFERMRRGFSSRFWLTFNQAMEAAGYKRNARGAYPRWIWPGPGPDPKYGVCKGEKGTTIVFFEWREKRQRDPETGEETARRYPVLKHFTVFNLDQVDGIPAPAEPEANGAALNPSESAEALSRWNGAPKVTHDGSGRACYSPRFDLITMPARETFESAEAYYATLFHEFAHSTGAASRLNRDGIVNLDSFGSHQYSKEELIAEFGAAFLCAAAGIANESTTENSAAYIASWRQRLTDNPHWIPNAAAAAQKAADYILARASALQQLQQEGN